MQAKGAQLYASMASSWRDRSQRLTVKMGQWWKARNSAGWRDRPIAVDEKKGKRYRNLPADVFVIADEDEDAGKLAIVPPLVTHLYVHMLLTGDEYTSSGDDASAELINISMYSTAPEVLNSFPCHEISSSGHLMPRCVCVYRVDVSVV